MILKIPFSLIHSLVQYTFWCQLFVVLFNSLNILILLIFILSHSDYIFKTFGNIQVFLNHV
jgi:hypothetical protein